MGNDYTDQLDEERDALAPPIDPADLEAVAPQLLPTPAPASVAPAPQQPVGTPVPAFDVKGYGEGADAAALTAAEGQRDDTDRAAKFLDAASLFNKAGLGHAGDMAASTRATRNDSFQDVMRRRAMSDQDTQRAKLQHDTGMAAALELGDSPESVKIKEMFGGTSVGQRLRASMGEDAWSKLPGKAIPGAKEQLASETSLMLAGMKGAAKKGGAKHRLETIVNAAGGPDSPRGQFYAQKFANATDEDLKFAEDLLKQDRSQEFQGVQNDLTRKATKENATTQFGRQKTLRTFDRGVGGASFDPENPPSTKQQTDFNKSLVDNGELYSSLKRIRDIVRDRGPQAFVGQDFADLQRLFGKVILKSKDTNNLGVLQKLDINALEKVYKNPTDFRSFVTRGDYMRNFNAGLADVLSEVSRQAKANKFEIPQSPSDLEKMLMDSYVDPGDVPGSTKEANSLPSGAKNLLRSGSNAFRSLVGMDPVPEVDTATPIQPPPRAGTPPAATPTKLPPGKYRSKVTGKVKIVHPDGREEEVAG